MALGRPISLTNNVASKIIRVLATNNQTVFTVVGGYRINQIGVFRNGVRLSNNSDFTALDGSTVTLINAAQTSDEVLFEIQDDFRVSDAIVSAASTQTIGGNLSITGDVSIGGSITGTVNATSLNATTGSFSGNVSVGGVLTYEDVTNIDSIGIITARSDVSIADKIVHTGDTNTAIRFPANDTFTVETAGSERVRVTSAGKFGIGTINPGDVLTVSGVDAFIKVDRSNGNPGIDFRYDGSTSNRGMIDVTSGGDLRLAAGGNTERLRIDSSGRLLVGSDWASAEDSSIIQSNGVSPASFYRASGSGGPNVSLKRTRGNIPTVYTVVQNNDNLGTINFSGSDGSAYVEGAKISAEVDGSPGTNDMPSRLIFATTADGASSTTERLRISSDGKVRVPDGGVFACGTDEDLTITHSGNDAVIENTVGHIYITNYQNNEDILLRTDDGGGGIANYVECDGSSGKVKLYYYGSKKLETTSDGVEVTGTISDSIGPLRRLGTSAAGGSSYTLVASDAGKQVRVSGNHTITIPDDVFSTGDMITIVAHSSSNVSITQGSGVSLYNASDGTTGNKTLAARTVCTILVAEGPDKMYISGGGIS